MGQAGHYVPETPNQMRHLLSFPEAYRPEVTHTMSEVVYDKSYGRSIRQSALRAKKTCICLKIRLSAGSKISGDDAKIDFL